MEIRLSGNPDNHPIMQADPCVSSNAPSLGSSGELSHPLFGFVFSWEGSQRGSGGGGGGVGVGVGGVVVVVVLEGWWWWWCWRGGGGGGGVGGVVVVVVVLEGWWWWWCWRGGGGGGVGGMGGWRGGGVDPDAGILPCTYRIGKHAFQTYFDGRYTNENDKST